MRADQAVDFGIAFHRDGVDAAIGHRIQFGLRGPQHAAVAGDPPAAQPVRDELEHRIDRHSLLPPDPRQRTVPVTVQTTVGHEPHVLPDIEEREHRTPATQLIQINPLDAVLAQYAHAFDGADPNPVRLDAERQGQSAGRVFAGDVVYLAVLQPHHATLGAEPYPALRILRDGADVAVRQSIRSSIASHASIRTEPVHAIAITADPQAAG